ncbi:MAG: SDR family oxidoreductase [Nitrospirales bacterium]
MDFGLRGKKAFVTGGSYGIGRAIALGLADEGCDVAICARQASPLEDTVQAVQERGCLSLGFQGDVTEQGMPDRLVKAMVQAWGTIHILVNNVGGGGQQINQPVETIQDHIWEHTFSVNTWAAIRFTRAAIPFMQRERWGRVVTVVSVQGREGGGRPWYNMSKSAEISLMKTLALDQKLVQAGLTFNSVAPGTILLKGNEWDQFKMRDPAGFHQVIQGKCPMNRPGYPEEVANVVTFMCSTKASLMNGACVAVDGGESRSF